VERKNAYHYWRLFGHWSGNGNKLIQIAHLTRTDRLLLGILIRHRRATRDQLMTALLCHRADDEPCAKIFDTYICKIRKKLKPHGIEIKTVWCAGYEIPLDSLERIKAMIAATQPALTTHRALTNQGGR
jgi:hypothetical protein